MPNIIDMRDIKPVDLQVARTVGKNVDKAITAEIDMLQEVMYFIVWRDAENVHSGYSLRDAIDAYNLI